VSVYVGVDQALKRTGLCVVESGQATVLQLIKAPYDMKGPERLVHIKTVLINTLWPFRDRITAAAYEGQSLGSLGDIDQLGNIGGVVALILADECALPNSRIFKVPPATLKKFVTGRANATKDLMMRTSAAEWGYDFTQDDVCDAHGLARFAAECLEQTATKRHRVEAVFSLLQKKKKRPPIKKLFPTTI
jgi:Holliday junction resolvasome RuvABC endonuclease subunit